VGVGSNICTACVKLYKNYTGVYILENTYPPCGRGNISWCHFRGGKYEKGKRKKGEMWKKKGQQEKERKKGDRIIENGK
jgi:hypothetical protein